MPGPDDPPQTLPAEPIQAVPPVIKGAFTASITRWALRGMALSSLGLLGALVSAILRFQAGMYLGAIVGLSGLLIVAMLPAAMVVAVLFFKNRFSLLGLLGGVIAFSAVIGLAVNGEFAGAMLGGSVLWVALLVYVGMNIPTD